MANNKNLLFILETIDNCPGISSGEVRQELCNRNGKTLKVQRKAFQYFPELNLDGTRRSFYGPVFKKDGSPLMVDSGQYSWYFSKTVCHVGFKKLGKDYGYWKNIHKNGYALTEEGKKKMKDLQSKSRSR